MLRQFIILLCATFIFGQGTSPTASEVNDLAKTSADALASSESKNDTMQPKQSGFVPLSRTYKDITTIQDRGFSFENSFQEVRRPTTTYLPAEPPLEVNSANVNSYPVPALEESVPLEDSSSSTSIITSGQNSGESTAYYASVLSGPVVSQTGAADTNNPVPKKPYKAVPLSPITKTITSQEAFGSPIGLSTYKVPLEDSSSSTSTITSGQSSGESTAYYASVLSGPVVSQTGAADTNNPAPKKPYKAVPPSPIPKTITSQNALGSAIGLSTHRVHNSGPTKTDATTSSTTDTDSVTIDSHEDKHSSTEAHKNSSTDTHKHSSTDAHKHSSHKSKYPVHTYQTVINPPSIQFIHSPTYAVNPVSHVPVRSKTVSVEAFDSVTALPPFRYTPAPSFIGYSPTPVPVIDPIPVPVLYDDPGVETFHHSSSHFAVGSEPIPVPVISEPLQYNVPSHVVHAKSFVESVYTPVGSHHHTIDHSSLRYEGYNRALSYSPASSVSSVSFNGLGVNYGW